LAAQAKEFGTASATAAAMRDLRRLPPSMTIPAIRQEPASKQDQILCMALAMYHEARGESETERLAVAQVIYNRAVHTDSTICATVWADSGSQFQWVRSIAVIVPRELSAWQAVQNSALRFARRRPVDGTHGATNFYNPALCSPNWANDGQPTILLHQVFLRIDGKYTGKASGNDPISQLDQFGRRRPSRFYASATQ
jgi:spore germination cell wall hydrolase CwlJ-like protein